LTWKLVPWSVKISTASVRSRATSPLEILIGSTAAAVIAEAISARTMQRMRIRLRASVNPCAPVWLCPVLARDQGVQYVVLPLSVDAQIGAHHPFTHESGFFKHMGGTPVFRNA